jgi:hypothetical protein
MFASLGRRRILRVPFFADFRPNRLNPLGQKRHRHRRNDRLRTQVVWGLTTTAASDVSCAGAGVLGIWTGKEC